MTLLRDVITIPERVSDSDFVMRLSEGVAHAHTTLQEYVVTESLKRNFGQALGLVGQAVQTGKSQAAFLHGSFGAGKSHFMAVLHEILRRNPEARSIPELADEISDGDRWLTGRKILPLTYHMLGARSIEEAVLGGYRAQITALHPDEPSPAVHKSDRMLDDAAKQRTLLGDEKFFHALSGGGTASAGWGAYRGGWDAQSYAAAAAAAPGTADRDRLVSDLTSAFFSGAVHSGEYLDIDTGLAVLSQHAKSLGYDAVVLFLDELVLWLSQHLSNLEFVNQEGGKLAKFVESADAHRPVPLVSFVARQRDLADFLGPHVPGAERQAFADVFRHGRGRFAQIPLEERNLPLIAERRLLSPKDATAKKVIDDAFASLTRRPDVWDTLRLGAQFDDAGIGSDEAVFRRLYPFSPALVATLVALSQALQRERTALKTMLRLLVDRRDTLEVNDLLGVAELFDELIGKGELPDEPTLRRHFETARALYRSRLRPALLRRNHLDEAGAATVPASHQFRIDDKLVKTLLLAALVPDVPALSNLTAAKLHALNYGSIESPLPGMEPQLVLGRLREISTDVPQIRVAEGPDPVVSAELSDIDPTQVLERVPATEDTPGARRRLLRELICSELGVKAIEGVYSELPHQRDWRGRRHQIDVVFGNVRNRDELPDSALVTAGEIWRVVVDYPFDDEQHTRRDDFARVESLIHNGAEGRTIFWLPLYLTADRLGSVGTLVKVNYVLAGGGDDRLRTLAPDLLPADRLQTKLMLEQQQKTLTTRLLECLKQAYGAARPQPGDVEPDTDTVFVTLTPGLRPENPVGGTLKAAFDHLAGQMLGWSYPGMPNLPEDEPALRPAELRKVLEYARRAVADEARRTTVEQADRQSVRRIVNHLKLGELVENQYVLNLTTSWWSRHLLQGARAQGYADRFPVRVLRELLDRPQPRGFDKQVQNLIIAVFALEQDFAWYRYEALVTVADLQGVTDDLELRQPRLPDEQTWSTAIRRASALFGGAYSPLRSATNLADLARAVRTGARQYSVAAQELVKLLEGHAGQLGIDMTATEGRLATGRRAAQLLHQLAHESDDLVLTEVLAAAELGVPDKTTARAITSGPKLVGALSTTHWKTLDTVAAIADDRAERVRAILDQLAISARTNQMGADLAEALNDAVRQAQDVLVIAPPPPPPPPPPPIVNPPKPPTPPPAGKGGERTVRAGADLQTALGEIQKMLSENPGRSIRITWLLE
ncbi:phage resistance protein [Micromonospora sp. NPDC005206]|uniref:phage resistance protein n=1 Tax=Micromonospora sp. NPDC005206 TaxID=3157022 RepID=UPI0033B261CA